jgi:hypothetical protein
VPDQLIQTSLVIGHQLLLRDPTRRLPGHEATLHTTQEHVSMAAARAGDAGVTLARMWLLVLMVPVALAGLTAMGARRRGAGIAISAVAGVCFPFTWAVWYLRDEHPYRHVRA